MAVTIAVADKRSAAAKIIGSVNMPVFGMLRLMDCCDEATGVSLGVSLGSTGGVVGFSGCPGFAGSSGSSG